MANDRQPGIAFYNLKLVVIRCPYAIRWSFSLSALLLIIGCSPRGAARTEALRNSLEPHALALLQEAQASLQSGQFTRALSLADSVEVYSSELADIPYLRGNAYLSMMRYDDARESFLRTLELDPQYTGAQSRLGDLDAARGLPADGLPRYLAEVELHPDSDLYTRIGRIYLEAGTADSSRWAFDRAIALDSSNAAAFMLYGQLMDQLGNIDEALDLSRRALALQPGNPNHQFTVGALLLRSGSVEESLSFLRKAADARLLHYPAQYNLGQALLRLGREEEAGKYFIRADTAQALLDQINLVQQAIARQPGEAAHWNHLGDLYRRAEAADQSADAFETALSVEPGNPDAHYGLATLAMADGNTAEAIRRYKLVLLDDDERTQVWLSLGLAYAVGGQCEEAREAWGAVLELDSDHTAAREYLRGLCQYRGS